MLADSSSISSSSSAAASSSSSTSSGFAFNYEICQVNLSSGPHVIAKAQAFDRIVERRCSTKQACSDHSALEA